MISTEKAFDLLPYAADIYDKLKISKYIEDNKITIDEDDDFKSIMLSTGLELGKYILKNSKDVKEEVFSIVAIVENKDVKEVKAQSFGKTYATFKGLLEDEDTMDFLKSAVE